METESFVRRAIRYAINNSPIRIDLRLNPYLRNPDRDFPQCQYDAIGFIPTGQVLDVGSGRRPFPPATVLVDKYIVPCMHNAGLPKMITGKDFVQADVQDLPFEDKFFDFVFCSHVLEHVNDPVQACAEIMRVGKRGYIETPRIGSDYLFAWGRYSHKWLVHDIGNKLCFFEMTKLMHDGIDSTAWRDVMSMVWHHPLQDAFYKHADCFNVMFNWTDYFNVRVFHADGREQEACLKVS